MNNTLLAFLLTFIAGFSTMIGVLVIFIKKKNHDKIVMASLAFAAGVMITVSVTDLVPESLVLLSNNLSKITTIIISFLGLLLGIVISMIAIILHNLPEGIATFVATSSDVKLGLSLAIAIAMHNIPEGISISVPIYYSTGSRKRAIFYTLISALSEPLGALLAFIFLKNFVNDTVLGILFSLIAGIMLQISFCELLPTARRYNNKKYLLLFFVIGVIFMLFKFLF